MVWLQIAWNSDWTVQAGVPGGPAVCQNICSLSGAGTTTACTSVWHHSCGCHGCNTGPPCGKRKFSSQWPQNSSFIFLELVIRQFFLLHFLLGILICWTYWICKQYTGMVILIGLAIPSSNVHFLEHQLLFLLYHLHF